MASINARFVGIRPRRGPRARKLRDGRGRPSYVGGVGGPRGRAEGAGGNDGAAPSASGRPRLFRIRRARRFSVATAVAGRNGRLLGEADEADFVDVEFVSGAGVGGEPEEEPTVRHGNEVDGLEIDGELLP